MRSAVWLCVSFSLGVVACRLAACDSSRQRARGAHFADTRFTGHWSSVAVSVAAVSVVVWLSQSANPDSVVVLHCALAASGVWLSLVDIDTHTVPRRSQSTVWAVSLPLVLAVTAVDPALSFGGAALGAFVMWLIMRATETLSGGDMGPADAVFAGYLGMYVGVHSVSLVPFALFVAFVSGGVVALALMVARTRTPGHLPFAPFLFLGAVVAVLR